MRDSWQLFLFRYILISLLGNGRLEWPGVALLVSVLPSGFFDGTSWCTNVALSAGVRLSRRYFVSEHHRDTTSTRVDILNGNALFLATCHQDLLKHIARALNIHLRGASTDELFRTRSIAALRATEVAYPS